MLTRLSRAGAALCVGLVAAIMAALLAHVAIDLVGDVALAHDAYDTLAHHSRDLAALVLVFALGGASLRFVFAALDGASNRRGFMQSLRTPVRPLPFVVAVAVAALVMVVGMESWDTFAATGTLDSLADALGGSPLLGLCIALPLASTLGWLAWRVLHWLASCSDVLLRTIEAWFAIGLGAMRPPAHDLVPFLFERKRRSSVLRVAAKRGPPAVLSA
ncbi:MAG: hypothetical protein JO060_12145 [Candidatus Eremiobacteraeota bacterium]|nr:hypothetical protein [Candidatus Eremiobacteraeota bacterium]MBV9646592.1 hypothetical protein [Candidatus Eremiobacteraeota bacterium]